MGRVGQLLVKSSRDQERPARPLASPKSITLMWPCSPNITLAA